jgi:hypothetical protein
MGACGRAHYDRAFTVDAVVDASLAVYGAAAARWGGGTR